MNLLAIDTSTDYLSIAILKDEKIAARFHKKTAMRHSILLVPMIAKLLKDSRLEPKDIDCFAVSIGPGSFTGLRIGVTVIKGFAYALKKPIVAVPTLDVIAQNAKKFKGIICPILDARKNKVYASIYKNNSNKMKRISKFLLLPFDELLKHVKKYDEVLFLGDVQQKLGTDTYFFTKIKIGVCPHFCRAEVVAKLGMENYRNKKFVKPEDLEPLYLYSKECDVTGK